MAEPVKVVVRGKDELDRAFRELRRETLIGMKPALVEIAEGVRSDAQTLATHEIPNIGPRWSRMRIGVKLSGVYVAPRSRRRTGSPRKNLAGLLMDRAMQPALDEHQDEALARLEMLVTVSAAKARFF